MIVHCAADTEDGHDGATSPDFVAPSSMTAAEAPLTDAEAATRTAARGTRKRFMCSLNTSGSRQLRCARAAAACGQARVRRRRREPMRRSGGRVDTGLYSLVTFTALGPLGPASSS